MNEEKLTAPETGAVAAPAVAAPAPGRCLGFRV